ncbi:MAG: hypothetical protein NTZ05_12430 [Chloroflexi bacterium]|nr:hypothetical protein [Chloroflexota bacterium]
MTTLQQIAQFNSLASLQQQAAALDDGYLAEGERALVTLQFGWEVPDWVVSGTQSAAEAAGAHLWAPVYASEGTLCIPVQKRSPAIVAVLGAISTLFTVLLIGVVIGAIIITVFKVLDAAERLGGSLGLLLAGGAALFLAPKLLTAGGEYARNPVDTSAAVQLAGLGILGYVAYDAAKHGALPGPLQDLAHSISPSLPPAQPSPALPPGNGGGGGSGGGSGSGGSGSGGSAGGAMQPGDTMCGWRRYYDHPGRTSLTLDVSPPNPARQEGASVIYTGMLTIQPVFGGVQPVHSARIDLVDADKCVIFDSAETDGNGRYELRRSLQSDELSGYRMFALYQGDTIPLSALSPAVTGIWHVVPGG